MHKSELLEAEKDNGRKEMEFGEQAKRTEKVYGSSDLYNTAGITFTRIDCMIFEQAKR